MAHQHGAELRHIRAHHQRQKPEDGQVKYQILDGHHRYQLHQEDNDTEADIMLIDVPDDVRARELWLALQNQGELHKPQLEDFIAGILRDGGTAKRIQDLAALGAPDCKALAQQGTAFVEQFMRDGIDHQTAVETLLEPVDEEEGPQRPPILPMPSAASSGPSAALGAGPAAPGPAAGPSAQQGPSTPVRGITGSAAFDERPAPPPPIHRPIEEARAELSAREHVPFSVDLRADESEIVNKAIRHAKNNGARATAEALYHICFRYLREEGVQ